MPTATATRKRATKKEEGPQHKLAHLIPPITKADEYVSRMIHGVRDIDLLRYAKQAQMSTLFVGDTGAGKTSLIQAYAATERLPLVVIECRDGIDPNTFFGQWVPTEDGKFRWVESDLVQVFRYGGVVDLAECNFMRPKISATFHSALRDRQVSVLERGGEVIHLHSDVQFVGDYNDGASYTGTFDLNPAFKNRFALKVPFDYDRGVEGQLVSMPILLEVADKLRERRKDGDIDTPVSTNMLIEFETFAIDISQDFAVENFIASFNEDEKPAVREVMVLHAATIAEQLEEMKKLAGEG